MKTQTPCIAICAIFSIMFICTNCRPDKEETISCTNHTQHYSFTRAQKNLFSTTGFDSFDMAGNSDSVRYYGEGKLYTTIDEYSENKDPLCKGYATTHEYEVYYLSIRDTRGPGFTITVNKKNESFIIYFLDEKFEYALNLIGDTVSKSIVTYPLMVLHGKEYKNVTAFRSERDSTNKILLNWEAGIVKVDYPKYNLILERL